VSSYVNHADAFAEIEIAVSSRNQTVILIQDSYISILFYTNDCEHFF